LPTVIRVGIGRHGLSPPAAKALVDWLPAAVSVDA